MRIALLPLITCLLFAPIAYSQDAPSKSALKLQIKELNKTISSESKEASKIQGNLTELKSDLSELQSAHSSAESSYKAKKEIYDSNEFDKKKAELKVLEGRAKDTGKSISKLEKVIEKSGSSITTSKEEKKTEEAALLNVKTKITAEKAAHLILINDEEKKIKEDEIKALEKEEKAHEKTISKVKQELDSAKSEKETAENEKQKLEATLASTNSNIEEIEQAMEDIDPKTLMKEVTKFEKEKSVLKLDVDKKVAEISEVELVLNQKNTVIDENKATVAKLQEQLKNL